MSHTSELDICNSALAKLGAEKIQSLTDQNKRARLCNQQYKPNRDKLLRMHPWNFAIKRVTLNPLVSSPPFGPLNEFQLPSDLIRIYKLFNQENIHKKEQDTLVSSDGTIDLIYIFKVENVALMDVSFQELLALMLAADISYALIQSNTLTQSLWAQYREERKEIRSFSSQESFPDSLQPDTFTDARQAFGQIISDPTKLG